LEELGVWGCVVGFCSGLVLFSVHADRGGGTESGLLGVGWTSCKLLFSNVSKLFKSSVGEEGFPCFCLIFLYHIIVFVVPEAFGEGGSPFCVCSIA
jgi:hypothetical protein